MWRQDSGIACRGMFQSGDLSSSTSTRPGSLIFLLPPAHCSTRTINGHDDLVRTIQLTPHFIISGSYDMSIRIWNRHTGRLLRTLKDPAQAHTNRIFKLDVDATRVVSCAQDQRIVIWDFGVGLDVRLFV